LHRGVQRPGLAAPVAARMAEALPRRRDDAHTAAITLPLLHTPVYALPLNLRHAAPHPQLPAAGQGILETLLPGRAAVTELLSRPVTGRIISAREHQPRDFLATGAMPPAVTVPGGGVQAPIGAGHQVPHAPHDVTSAWGALWAYRLSCSVRSRAARSRPRASVM